MQKVAGHLSAALSPLFGKQIAELAFQFVELRAVRIPGSRKPDGNYFLNLSRPVRHDDYPVREVDALVNSVGHKQDRLSKLLPDPKQFVLQTAPGQCVQ